MKKLLFVLLALALSFTGCHMAKKSGNVGGSDGNTTLPGGGGTTDPETGLPKPDPNEQLKDYFNDRLNDIYTLSASGTDYSSSTTIKGIAIDEESPSADYPQVAVISVSQQKYGNDETEWLTKGEADSFLNLWKITAKQQGTDMLLVIATKNTLTITNEPDLSGGYIRLSKNIPVIVER